MAKSKFTEGQTLEAVRVASNKLIDEGHNGASTARAHMIMGTVLLSSIVGPHSPDARALLDKTIRELQSLRDDGKALDRPEH